MKYQLVLHNGTAVSAILSQSPELPNEASVSGWYTEELPKYEIPEGQQVGMVPENHPWYSNTDSVVSEPVVSEPVSFPEPTPVPAFEPVSDKEPSFNDLMKDATRRWEQEEKDAVAEREALAVVLRNFNRRK